ncbi:MAG: hypothetical protein CMN78_02735 [Spirochaetales bacterium]|nr:hypothetical protein [Spirochaetales bacterium]
MKITEIEFYLENKTKKELIAIVIKLYRLSKHNQELLHVEINPENENMAKEKYKKIIKDEFFPERGDPKLRYSIIRKAITDFKKICRKPENLADVMLCYIENGVDFAIEYGDIDEDYYIGIENIFADTLEYIFDNKIENLLSKRCMEIMLNTGDTGFGFGHGMNDLYYAYYNIDEEDDL